MNTSPPVRLFAHNDSILSSPDLAFCLWLWVCREGGDVKLQPRETSTSQAFDLISKLAVDNLFMLGLGMSVSAGEKVDFVKAARNKLVHVTEGKSVCSRSERPRLAASCHRERGARHDNRSNGDNITHFVTVSPERYSLVCRHEKWQNMWRIKKRSTWTITTQSLLDCHF